MMNRQFNNNDYKDRSQNQNIKQNNQREAGISDDVWNVVINIIEITTDIIKAILVVGGILAASLADIAMGSISISILFGGVDAVFYGVPVTYLATMISAATSAIQIYFWGVLQKRGIGLKEIFHWKKLNRDVQSLFSGAIIVWVLDTFMDVAPIELLTRNSPYQEVPWLYWSIKAALIILVIMICGFSEVFTSNMRTTLGIISSKKVIDKPKYQAQNKPTGNNNGNQKPQIPQHQQQTQAQRANPIRPDLSYNNHQQPQKQPEKTSQSRMGAIQNSTQKVETDWMREMRLAQDTQKSRSLYGKIDGMEDMPDELFG